MKNYFLVVLFTLVIFSIYSVSADYNGTLNVGVGSSVQVTIGEPLYFTVANIPATCTTGQTACVGTNSYLCINSLWVNQGQVNGKCGYSSGGTPDGGTPGGGGSPGGIFTPTSFGGPNPETNNLINKPSNSSNNTPIEIGTTSKITGTGSVINGLSQFASTPAGIVSIIFVVLVLSAVVITLSRKKTKAIVSSEQVQQK